MSRVLLAVTVFAMLTVSLEVSAQETGKVPRIGVLCAVKCEGPLFDAFRQRLRERGWREGRTATIEYRAAGEGTRAAAAPGERAAAVEARRPTARGASAIVHSDDAVFTAHRVQLAELALKHQVPTLSGARSFVEAGGLLSYGSDQADLYRSAATYVGRILKGARPVDLPIEQPTKFELVINLKTARALGLTIPPSLLARADAIIQ